MQFFEAMSPGDAGVIAGLGYGVVFAGIIALLIVVAILGACFKLAGKKKETPAAVAVPDVPAAEAPGSAGQVKLYDVEPKTAAMLMAIVADKMGRPLNELRFISIREVKNS